uniref:Transmembrane protein 241 n=1 Tax=Anas platyrhynchos platyrhynchos TaxID=8840 RepID=U3IFH0_ANAPP
MQRGIVPSQITWRNGNNCSPGCALRSFRDQEIMLHRVKKDKQLRDNVCFYFRWQTLVGGLLLHISWKLGWVEISLCSRSEILSWLPASVLFVGIIYAGSRALSRLPIPVFLAIQNAAEVITCGFQKFVQKEVIGLLIGVFKAPPFDPNGYFWALIHLICVGKSFSFGRRFLKSKRVVEANQLYLVIFFSCVPLSVLLCPSGDLFSALDFPFLYFYRFHSSCCASGLLGFLLMLHTVKLRSSTTSGQYAAWSFLAKVRGRPSQEHSRSMRLTGGQTALVPCLLTLEVVAPGHSVFSAGCQTLQKYFWRSI